MPSQGVSSNVASQIDIGNAVVYWANEAFTSFSNAQSSTKWRKLGILKDGSQIDRALEKIDFLSGVPLRKIQTFYTREDFRAQGQMLEFSPTNLGLASGLSITRTTKASSPAPTTVATGSTKTVINVASATGYAVDDEIAVGTTPQYGVIKSIASNAITLYEGLSNDTAPTTGEAVAKVDKSTIIFGATATPPDVALKISKTLVGGYGTIDVYILKAKADGNMTLAWADNGGNVEGVGIPFLFDAYADDAVESGALAQAVFTQS